jgi:uncharacterized coiled-coil DUF342 family protein
VRAEHAVTAEDLARAQNARRTLRDAYDEAQADARRVSEELRALYAERAHALERVGELERTVANLNAELAHLRERLRGVRREARVRELRTPGAGSTPLL